MGVTKSLGKASKKFICKICNKRFSSAMLRLEHLRSNHPQYLIYTCLECGVKCETRQGFTYHINVMHKNKERIEKRARQKAKRARVKCLYCSTLCSSKLSFNHHIRFCQPEVLETIDSFSNKDITPLSDSASKDSIELKNGLNHDAMASAADLDVPSDSNLTDSSKDINTTIVHSNEDTSKSLGQVAKLELACAQFALLHGKHAAQLHFAKMAPELRIGWRKLSELMSKHLRHSEHRDISDYNKKFIPPDIASSCGQYAVACGIDEAQWEFTLRYPKYVFSYHIVWRFYNSEKEKFVLEDTLEKPLKYFDKWFVVTLNKYLSKILQKTMSTVKFNVKKFVLEYNRNVPADNRVCVDNVVDEWLHCINNSKSTEKKSIGNLLNGNASLEHSLSEKGLPIQCLPDSDKSMGCDDISSDERKVVEESCVQKVEPIKAASSASTETVPSKLHAVPSLIGPSQGVPPLQPGTQQELQSPEDTKTAPLHPAQTVVKSSDVEAAQSKCKKKLLSLKEFITGLNQYLMAKKISVRDTETVIKKHVMLFNKIVPQEERISHQNIFEEWLHYFNYKVSKSKPVEIKSMLQDSEIDEIDESLSASRRLSKREAALHKKKTETTELAPPIKKYIVSLNQHLKGKELSLKDTQQMIKNHVTSFNRRVSHDDQISYQNTLVEWLHLLNTQATGNKKRGRESLVSSARVKDNADQSIDKPPKKRRRTSLQKKLSDVKIKIKRPDHSSTSTVLSSLELSPDSKRARVAQKVTRSRGLYCGFCNAYYGNKLNFTAHFRLFHPEVLEKFSSKEEAPVHVRDSTSTESGVGLNHIVKPSLTSVAKEMSFDLMLKENYPDHPSCSKVHSSSVEYLKRLPDESKRASVIVEEKVVDWDKFIIEEQWFW